MSLEKILNKIFRRRDITRKGELYLRRYYLTPRSWPIKVFLHVIYKPDDDEFPHDHPWPFFGLVLSGGYFEAIYKKLAGGKVEFSEYKHRYLGTVAYRGMDAVHQIDALHNEKKCWTLIITGKPKRIWGFFTDKGRVEWNVYQNKPNAKIFAEDDPGRD